MAPNEAARFRALLAATRPVPAGCAALAGEHGIEEALEAIRIEER